MIESNIRIITDDTFKYTFLPELQNKDRCCKMIERITTKNKGTKETPIYIIDNFLTTEECKEIINLITDKKESKVLNGDKSIIDVKSRISYTCEGGKKLVDIMDKIHIKMCKILDVPNSSAEGNTITYYPEGGYYKEHCDFFYQDNIDLQNGQRTWTFMVYLNNVDKGGNTTFPKLNLEFKPVIGKALIWCNLTNTGEGDMNSLHKGSVIDTGEKYILTNWFRASTRTLL